jgi:hypothetical protein
MNDDRVRNILISVFYSEKVKQRCYKGIEGR